MRDWLLLIAVAIFGALLKEVSEPLREKVEEFVLDMEKRAKQTPNVFDDMFVDLLKKVLAINHDS